MYLTLISSRRLYESSLYQHWHDDRGQYYLHIYVNIAKGSGALGDKTITQLYGHFESGYEPLSDQSFESLFLFGIYCQAFCFVVFIIELTNKF